MKHPKWKQLSLAKKIAISLPLAVAFMLVLTYGWFAGIYKTSTWPWNPPESLHTQGRSYVKSPAPAEVTISDEFEKVGSLKPFGYDILGYRNYDTSTSIYIHWRDQKYYPYSLVGGP